MLDMAVARLPVFGRVAVLRYGDSLFLWLYLSQRLIVASGYNRDGTMPTTFTTSQVAEKLKLSEGHIRNLSRQLGVGVLIWHGERSTAQFSVDDVNTIRSHRRDGDSRKSVPRPPRRVHSEALAEELGRTIEAVEEMATHLCIGEWLAWDGETKLYFYKHEADTLRIAMARRVATNGRSRSGRRLKM